MEKMAVPISEKYTLTVNEAGAYFNVGVKRLRKIITENPGRFTVLCGSKQLIIRHKFEEFLDEITEI